MAKITDLNKKVNIKQPTGADLVSTGQPVLNRYETVSTVGQTILNLPFFVDTNNSEVFMLYVNGQLLTKGASNDFIFSSVDASGFSSQVTFNSALSADLNIIAIKLGSKVERNISTDTKFSDIYTTAAASFQPYVSEAATLTASATPGAGQFYSTIVGRSSIPDITADLKARMGNQRIEVQSIYQLQNEFGANGETVWAATNEDKNLVRFVGAWTNVTNNYGSRPQSGSNITDYVEIVFFGTGLNLLIATPGGTTKNIVASVDGGAEGSNLVPAGSDILGGRNYSPNVVIPVVSGLTQGLHTVKIRNNTAAVGIDVCGYEVLNQTSTINVRGGIGYSQLKSITSAGTTTAYNAAFDAITKDGATAASLGTRGGRVIAYMDTDGTIKKRATAVNSAAAYLTSADHSYEEVVRTYHWREFGAGRSDDFSYFSSTGTTSLAFTLDDGTTTLVGSNVAINGSNQSVLSLGSSGAFITLTFVGTGLDIIRQHSAAGTADTHSVIVDGVNIGNLSTVAETALKTEKIVSGLPYGTHTIRFTRTAFVNQAVLFKQFIVHQPKKPTLPANVVELADYSVMADYAANSTAGTVTIATGVLRKLATRESTYLGTWTAGSVDVASYSCGFPLYTNTSTNYVQYTFFGTGFEYRFNAPAAATTFTVSVDGSSTLTGYSTSFYGGVTSFNTATGLVTNTGSNVVGSGIRVSGIALGLHTVRVTFTTTAGSAMYPDAFDIITPIHAYKQNLYADLQNTLAVGSQGISDTRKLTPTKDVLPATKAWAMAVGIASGPTVTSTSFVPCPDMGVTVSSNGGYLKIQYSAVVGMSVGGAGMSLQAYLNGVAVGNLRYTATSTGNQQICASDSIKVPVSRGAHKVDLYWKTDSGTATAWGTYRSLLVEET